VAAVQCSAVLLLLFLPSSADGCERSASFPEAELLGSASPSSLDSRLQGLEEIDREVASDRYRTTVPQVSSSLPLYYTD
jgi:hypothetical protein